MKAAFEKATSEKLRCQDEVNRTNTTIHLANRLVKGLEVCSDLQPCCLYICLLWPLKELSSVSETVCVCVFQSENVRWVHSVAQYREQESTLCGDVLLTAAFISYAGSFSKRYRHELLLNLWMPYLRSQKVHKRTRLCCL